MCSMTSRALDVINTPFHSHDRLGLIGDIGQTENSAETLDHLTASNPDSVINVGDLSYADGYQPRYGNSKKHRLAVAPAMAACMGVHSEV